MVAGIIFQLISMVMFVGLGLDFILRATQKRPYTFQAQRIERKQQARRSVEAPGPSPTGDATPESSEGSVPQIKEKMGGHSNTVRQWWILMGAALVSSAMIICRGVYRSIELKQGWTGFLITHRESFEYSI